LLRRKLLQSHDYIQSLEKVIAFMRAMLLGLAGGAVLAGAINLCVFYAANRADARITPKSRQATAAPRLDSDRSR